MENVRVNPTANLMFAILTVLRTHCPLRKGLRTLSSSTHLSFEKDNAFVAAQSSCMSEVTRGMYRGDVKLV